jgi:hypothetical protein
MYQGSGGALSCRLRKHGQLRTLALVLDNLLAKALLCLRSSREEFERHFEDPLVLGAGPNRWHGAQPLRYSKAGLRHGKLRYPLSKLVGFAATGYFLNDDRNQPLDLPRLTNPLVADLLDSFLIVPELHCGVNFHPG